MSTILQFAPAVALLTGLFAICAYQVRRLSRIGEERRRQWREAHGNTPDVP